MYQVLARKYRPRNFNELVGQNHVSRALTSALERGRLHHAYLFTGTRGVGKTTIARILAKCLNCETGVTSTPCEVCATCKAVNEGRFIDLIEIDAASRTKVEDTRELLDNVPYAPTQGRFKVYLIDEVHMLSTHSFNALLKTLEEPPAHVKFLFATTDPQKLPITVISRCLQFTLRPLAVDEITEHLTGILQQESIPADQDAIWQIAESAQGSLRDALSLADQAIAYGQGEVHHQDVKEMLGLIDRTIIYDLIAAIHQNQKGRISELLMQFRQQALDVSLVLDQLISTLHELALLQYLPDLGLKYSAEINAKIMQCVDCFSRICSCIKLPQAAQTCRWRYPGAGLEMRAAPAGFPPNAPNEIPVPPRHRPCSWLPFRAACASAPAQRKRRICRR
jgi:DNA polymerase-3 subunit gamma/tau